MVAIAATAFVVILTVPLFRKAVTEFNLPLTNADVIRQQAAEKHLDPALIAARDLRRDEVRRAAVAGGGAGPDADHARDGEVPGPYVGRHHVHRSPTSATPQVNIAYGSYYLRYLLDHYNGNEPCWHWPPTTAARRTSTGGWRTPDATASG